MFGFHSENICPYTPSDHFKGYRQGCVSGTFLEVTPWLKPSQQAGIRELRWSDRLKGVILMLPDTNITDRILKHLRRSPDCELEEVVFSCREFTWHDTFVELVRLNQAGRVEMKTYGEGTCNLRLCSSNKHDLRRTRRKGSRSG